MQIEKFVQLFMAVNFVILGLSHVFQPKVWSDFFIRLHRLGRPGAFANGFLSLSAGAMIVAGHNVWTGLPTILTVMGWLYVLKSLVTFVLPEMALRSMGKVRANNSHIFILPGVAMIALGLTVAYCGLRTSP
jgi:hypothetical protein